MKKTIITQDANIAVNYDNAVKLFYYELCKAEDVNTLEQKDMYVIAAEMNNGSEDLVLGFYETKEKVQEVFGQLFACITSDSAAGFIMPD